MTEEIDVLAVGHAIVDVLAHCAEALLDRVGLGKGMMTLVEGDRAAELYEAMGPAVEISGGSAANTAVGVASFGGRAAFVGKVAADDFGRVFSHDIRASGVAFDSPAAPYEPGGLTTARCHVMVTSDAQRTMGTYLGIAGLLGPADVPAGWAERAAISYLEGYLVGTPGEAALDAVVAAAKASGRRMALTLSDPSWVGFQHEAFQLLLPQADILLANEAEALAMSGQDDLGAALRWLRDRCAVVTVTRSEHGAVVAGESGDPVAVAACPVERVVDTTGAGDLYAAGFLLGLARGLPLDASARLGTLAASEVIAHDGARPHEPLAKLAAGAGLDLGAA